jgi:hypothetical protein
LPHSEIPGSKPVCGSPELIAAYHVLHRHLSPRHSPYALSSLTIDMRTNTGVQRAFASPPTVLILLGTLRCVWSEKTTVCRIFSCQRSSGGKIPRKRLVSSGFLPRTPWLTSLAGPLSPRSVSFAGTSYSTRPARPMQARRVEILTFLPPGRVRHFPHARRTRQGERVVENTGLEPVTSWLQTRRSPS